MLKDRASKWGAANPHFAEVGVRETPTPIFLAANPYFAIVDGELVTVLGTTDIPGMSPAYWCSDSNGISAPVSFKEARIFTTAQQALQVLESSKTAR